MLISFSVPLTAIAQPSTLAHSAMEVDKQEIRPPPSTKPMCDVEGCDVPRKYRLVQDWHRGACGMVHLKVLETQ